MGDEAYIVVDFVNDNSCMFEEPSTDNTTETPTKRSSAIDAVHISDDGEIAMANSSPFTSVQLPNNFTFPDEHKNDSDNEKKDKGSSQEETGHEMQVDKCEGDVKSEAIEVEEEVEMTLLEICASEKEKDLDQKVDHVKTGRKKVFSAGHGLKKVKIDGIPSSAKADDHVIPDETQNKGVISNVDKESETGSASPTLHKFLNASHSSPGRKSPSDLMRRSPTLEASTGSPSRGSPSSIVRQNKLLFDQQIADELKTKFSNPQDIVIPRQGSLGGANAFERGIIERRGSLKDGGSNTSLELDLTGIVAGARSLFEGELAGKSSKTEMKKSSSNNQTSFVDKPEPMKVEDCDSIIINSVPELSTTSAGKRKKKKFPFKKKGKGVNKRVELIGAKLIDANQPYDERAIDVERITSVNDLPDEGGKPDSFVGSDAAPVDANQSCKERAIDVETIPSVADLPSKGDKSFNHDYNVPHIDANIEQKLGLPEKTGKAEAVVTSVNIPEQNDNAGSGDAIRNKSKRRRLCKPRESISSHYEPIENDSEAFMISNDVLNDDTNGTIFNLTSEDEEAMLRETLITDVATCSWSFDKLEEFDAENKIVSEKQHGKLEVLEEPIMSLSNIEPIKIDIDALQNESSIDEDIALPDNPVIRVSGLEMDSSDLTKIEDNFDEMSYRSDVTGSFYDEDGGSMDMDNSSNTLDDNRKKKKKRFPFHIKLGRKKDKSRGELSPPDVFSEDTNSESSYKISKKQKKNKSRDNLDAIGQTISTSSVDSISKQSSTSSLPSPTLGKHKEKGKSKIPFFKKKKSKTSTPNEVSSPHSKTDENELGSKSKLSFTKQGTPTTPSEHRTNEHTNHTNGHTDVTNGHRNHTNGHTNVTNGHTNVTNGHNRDVLI